MMVTVRNVLFRGASPNLVGRVFIFAFGLFLYWLLM
jgi:hypothetical protein